MHFALVSLPVVDTGKLTMVEWLNFINMIVPLVTITMAMASLDSRVMRISISICVQLSTLAQHNKNV